MIKEETQRGLRDPRGLRGTRRRRVRASKQPAETEAELASPGIKGASLEAEVPKSVPLKSRGWLLEIWSMALAEIKLMKQGRSARIKI